MSAIVASVGQGGKNQNDDVVLVQKLLRGKGLYAGEVDGICGTKTIAAILLFQKGFLSEPDGLIEPEKTTWKRLCSAGGWDGDSSQWPQEKKIESLHPNLRPKVQNLLDALNAQGFQPKVFYGWRSVAIQLELYKKGNSRLKFSFHNAQKPDGTPNSYAADIVDSRFGWSDQAEQVGFWKALGKEAKRQGLIWGGDWEKFRDVAHVQLVPNGQLAAVKHESGL
ncbi:M15 family metallopeptidase [Geomonas sp. RF6]|uniref:peptidoglycan-binding protein n=1 Tax=Geomonas sp. RF6 TaxID=2897342 RepID=UPI001E4F4142|nr:peptidoglycan-binding protein [Geomonas sp. RF6]UFS70690.1 M15 family metallopeptidase [Geomonas sp. RF6]